MVSKRQNALDERISMEGTLMYLLTSSEFNQCSERLGTTLAKEQMQNSLVEFTCLSRTWPRCSI